MNWYWYWHIKKKHKPRLSCEAFFLNAIDSFDMFKHPEAVQLVKESADKLSLSVPRYSLKAFLQDDDSLLVQYSGGMYLIPVEKKSCNYGGFYRFFHCPKCDKRMRKLYCIEGRYQCRKCANMAYYSQRLRPYARYNHMKFGVEECLQNRAGSLKQKPPWMKKYTFQKLRQKYVKYDELSFNALKKELLVWHGSKAQPFLSEPYCFLVPYGLNDAYIERIGDKIK